MCLAGICLEQICEPTFTGGLNLEGLYGSMESIPHYQASRWESIIKRLNMAARFTILVKKPSGGFKYEFPSHAAQVIDNPTTVANSQYVLAHCGYCI